jgi:hypothetical protein
MQPLCSECPAALELTRMRAAVERVLGYCKTWGDEAAKKMVESQGADAEYWRTKAHVLRTVGALLGNDRALLGKALHPENK